MISPYIDERIKHVGVSKLREMTSDFLRQMARERLAYVLQDAAGDEPLAVILSYEMFLEMQALLLGPSEKPQCLPKRGKR